MFGLFKKKVVQQRLSHPSIERARLIARILDTSISIPFTNKKIGVDPLLGMLPVGGDVISALLALYILYVAYELGLPRHVIARMGLNTTLDLLLGAIPVVGDISDFFIRSNLWNLKLLEEAYHHHASQAPGAETFNDTATEPTIIDVIAEPQFG